jgi:hypothetical protein
MQSLCESMCHAIWGFADHKRRLALEEAGEESLIEFADRDREVRHEAMLQRAVDRKPLQTSEIRKAS